MRRLSIAAVAAVIAALAVAGVAIAANQYDLPIASTSPKGKGSPSKPFPTGVKFGYTVKDENGPRGAPVKTYKIAFQGLTTKYAKKFPKCKYSDTITGGPLSQVQAKCRKAKVGSGRIESLVTPDANAGDPNSVSFYCNLQLTLYNLGYGLAIRLDADNITQPTSQDGPIGCIVPTHRSIEARFKTVRIGGVPSTSLNFDVFEDLRHNNNLTITVANVESRIPRKTTRAKVRGKRRKVGLWSSIGCGKRSKRDVRVTFVDENGDSENVREKVRC